MNTNIGIGRLTLLCVLLIGWMPVVNADTLPVEGGFQMVACKAANAKRCAQTTMHMDESTYQTLGSPSSVRYKYRFNKPGTSEGTRFYYDPTHSPYFRYTAKSFLESPSIGIYFTLTKVCVDGECIKTDLKRKSVYDWYITQILYFKDNLLPVKLLYSMDECGFGICGRAELEINNKYLNLIENKRNTKFYFQTDKDVEISGAKIVYDSGKLEHYFNKTDLDHPMKAGYHFSLVLDQICLQYKDNADDNCLDVKFTRHSSKEKHKTFIMDFPIPGDPV